MTKYLRRKILPRRPFDATLEQDCSFFKSTASPSDSEHDALIVLVPLLSSRTEDAVPFYHPKVAGIAFRYIHSLDHSLLQIDFVPLEAIPPDTAFDSAKAYYPEDSRTYRTALNLLTMLNKHGKGRNKAQAYQKRVYHDTIVPREEFQDLYLVLKEKYAWIMNDWKENTDPVKHVFEVGLKAPRLSFVACLADSRVTTRYRM
jgi:tRNASer (uridine44-2'-O)-methyltransferase